MTKKSKFPNGIENYLETHFEIVQAITIEYMQDEPKGIVKDVFDANGQEGLILLAEKLTDKFEKDFKNEVMKEDYTWVDTLANFISKEIYNIPI